MGAATLVSSNRMTRTMTGTRSSVQKRRPTTFRWSRVGTGAAGVALFGVFWGAIAATAGPDGAPSSESSGPSTTGQVIVIDRRLLEQPASGAPSIRTGRPVATEPANAGQKARRSRAS